MHASPQRMTCSGICLCNEDGSACDLIYQPMSARDSARLVAGELVAERLGFADPGKGTQRDVGQESIDTPAHLFVGAAPVLEILLRL